MKYIITLSLLFLSFNLFAQLPESERGKATVIAKDINLHISNIATIPSDTITTAATNSIAIKNGIFYVKRTYWVPLIGVITLESGTNIYLVADSTNTPPGVAPDDSTYYLLGGSPTGAWAGQARKIALYASGSYTFISGVLNDYAITIDDQIYHQFDGSTWPVVSGVPLLTVGNIGPARGGTINNSNFTLITNNANRIIIAGTGAITVPGLAASDTGFIVADPGGKLYRRNAASSTDTTNNKPLGISATGKPYRMTYWPGSGGGASYSAGYGMSLTSSTFKVDTSKIQTKLFWFDLVTDGGADSTGVIDATPAWNSAFAYLKNHGGGVIYVRNGVFKTSSAIDALCNCQIKVPFSSSNGVGTKKTHYLILGETPPSFTNGNNPTNTTPVMSSGGAKIKSTITTGATRAAVIGFDSVAQFNFNYLTVRNISIEVKNSPAGAGPVIGGIGAKKASSLNTYDVVVRTDTGSYYQVLPTNDVAGIETPDVGSETMSRLQNTLVERFKTGFSLGEHTQLDQAQAFSNYIGFEIKPGYHDIIGTRTGSFWNTYDIKTVGSASNVKMNMDIEYLDSASYPTYWQKHRYAIDDASNYLNGEIGYHVTKINVGVDYTGWTKNGAGLIVDIPLDGGILARANTWTAINTIGSPTTISSFSAAGTRLRTQGLIYSEGKSTDAIPNGGVIAQSSYGAPFISGYRSNGTISSPTTVVNNDALLSIGGAGYDGTSWPSNANSVAINFIATGTHSSSSRPTQIDFKTTAASSTVLTTRYSINSAGDFFSNGNKFYWDQTNGRLGIGTSTAPVGGLEIKGTGSTNGGLFITGTNGGGGEGMQYNDGTGTARYGGIYYPGSSVVAIGNRAANGTLSLRANNSTAGLAGESTIVTVANTGVTFAASLAMPYVAKTSTYTITASDNLIECTSGTFTVTLPTAASIAGREYWITNTGSGTITIGTTSSQTFINVTGTPTTLSVAQFSNYRVVSNGANWLAYKIVN